MTVTDKDVKRRIFPRPLVLERGWTDHHHLFDITQFLEHGRGGNSLNSLSQTHIVGQHRPATKDQVHGTLFLVGVQSGGEHFERAVAAFDLIEKPLFLLLDFGTILQQFQMFSHSFSYLNEGAAARAEAAPKQPGRPAMIPVGNRLTRQKVGFAFEQFSHGFLLWQWQFDAHGNVYTGVQVDFRATRALFDKFIQAISIFVF